MFFFWKAACRLFSHNMAGEIETREKTTSKTRNDEENFKVREAAWSFCGAKNRRTNMKVKSFCVAGINVTIEVAERFNDWALARIPFNFGDFSLRTNMPYKLCK